MILGKKTEFEQKIRKNHELGFVLKFFSHFLDFFCLFEHFLEY